MWKGNVDYGGRNPPLEEGTLRANRSEVRTSNASGILTSGKLSTQNQLSHTFEISDLETQCQVHEIRLILKEKKKNKTKTHIAANSRNLSSVEERVNLA